MTGSAATLRSDWKFYLNEVANAKGSAQNI